MIIIMRIKGTDDRRCMSNIRDVKTQGEIRKQETAS